MFVLVARYYMKEGTEELALELLKSVIPLARQEPGCLTYMVNQSTADPRQLMLFERYVDEAAFQTHAATPYVREIVLGKVVPMIEKRERETFIAIEP
jgi:autoinducer 2-degrading protein